MREVRQNKQMKPWQAIIVLALTGLTTFIGMPLIAYVFNLGLSATLMNEIMMLIFAVAAVLIFGGNLRSVFPLYKPKVLPVVGTILFWMGSYGFVMITTLFITALFPEQMLSTNESLSNAIGSSGFLISFFVVAISPAICEEAVFRGVFLNSLWGRMNKWAVILITSAVFGAFHGSIWRFLPTACLGIAMAYLLVETNNMFYNMLFHAINNTLPVVLLSVLNFLYGVMGVEDIYSSVQKETTTISMWPSFGLYFSFLGGAAFLVYIGNYLIHKDRPGYQNGLFPKEKKKALFILIGITLGCMVVGIMIYMLGILSDPTFLDMLFNDLA
ncbi:CPBP family intramembrane metalloprotease [Lachnospiraceae bacterium OttesenSCG-928-E19]|nr:CPBP family intramembrane metalloprotease [Lachnospiraceae bacterium OttesenSCG-928-E19]